MVGLDGPVELCPRGGDDNFLVGSECLENRHLLIAAGPLDRKLDFRKHPLGVGVCHKQRASFASSGDGEVVSVD